MQFLFMISMFLTAGFLILLVLVQRGRGGGLAGAFGGMGGQSAFGTKAGDLFTRITIITAVVWIVVCALAVRLLNAPGSSPFGAGGGPSTSAFQATGEDQPTGGDDAAAPTSPGVSGGETDAGAAAAPGGSPPAGDAGAAAATGKAEEGAGDK